MNINESILINTKKLLGLAEDDTSFDIDLILHINSAFDRLHDLGVGPKDTFTISDDRETWTDFFGNGKVLPRVCTYVVKYVKRAWDPPTGGVLDSLDRQIKEDEWLLNAAMDPTDVEKEYMHIKPLWGEEIDND